jgi:hypothetical protein
MYDRFLAFDADQCRDLVSVKREMLRLTGFRFLEEVKANSVAGQRYYSGVKMRGLVCDVYVSDGHHAAAVPGGPAAMAVISITRVLMPMSVIRISPHLRHLGGIRIRAANEHQSTKEDDQTELHHTHIRTDSCHFEFAVSGEETTASGASQMTLLTALSLLADLTTRTGTAAVRRKQRD